MDERSTRRTLHRSVWQGIVMVVEEQEGRRTLHFGSHLQQSAMRLDDPETLVLNYTRQSMSMLLFHAAPRRGLMIGLGGGSMARFLLRHYPALQLDVVEISPEVVEIARRYFLLPEEPRLRIHLEEGGRFLSHAGAAFRGYDLLLVDAFDDKGMAATLQAGAFFQHGYDRLAPRGVMALNMTCGTQPRRCQVLEQAMGAVFAQEVLHLMVEGTSNTLLMACRHGLPWGQWSQVGVHGKALEARTGLPFSDYLDRIQQQNPELMQRVSGRLGG